MKVYELNLDGLVGPTHNYAGLAQGNIASLSNALTYSNPQKAALQGIAKMRFLHSLGIKQGLIPPHQRPNLHLLHQLGFNGTPAEQIQKAHKAAPELLAAAYSASSMWTANAATIAPSVDTADGTLHITAANLLTNLHRQQETGFTQSLLQRIFANTKYFTHHQPLPCSSATKDEGAANHNRLCSTHDQTGIHVFVYNQSGASSIAPRKYPARQTHAASAAIARKHLLMDKRVVLVQQNPEVVDQGVFHNDVIAVANESVLLVHEMAFVNQKQVLDTIRTLCDFPISIIELSADDLPVQEAVTTYLFNSQLITKSGSKHMLLLAPVECQNSVQAKHCIDSIIADSSNPIQEVHYIDLKQSMQNGGGPACLRLRIAINEQELAAMHTGVLVDDALLTRLEQWIKKHYRTELNPKDLLDPLLIDESLRALDELTHIIQIGSIYPFQLEQIKP